MIYPGSKDKNIQDQRKKSKSSSSSRSGTGRQKDRRSKRKHAMKGVYHMAAGGKEFIQSKYYDTKLSARDKIDELRHKKKRSNSSSLSKDRNQRAFTDKT